MGYIIDSHVDAMSLNIIDETIFPSSTKIAEFADIFITVAEIVPPAVVILSLSPTFHEFSQLRIEDLVSCSEEKGNTTSGFPSSIH